MEISAAKVCNSAVVALSSLIQGHVASDWNVPENVDVPSYKDEPMQDVLGLLLDGNFGFALFNAVICFTLTIHLLQE